MQKRILRLSAFALLALLISFGARAQNAPSFTTLYRAQIYPAPPNVGLLAARPVFCSATGQTFYATDTTTLYYSTVAGSSCTWTAVGGSSGLPTQAAPITSYALSPNCPAGSVTAPCFAIPASGGCVVGAVTSNVSGVITFTGSFPSPAPVVGDVAWVNILGGNGICQDIIAPSSAIVTACGQKANGQMTITAVSPGVSITVSHNCENTQNGTNAVLYYAPNIYTAFVAACTAASGSGNPNQFVRLDRGFYAVDNSQAGVAGTPACQMGNGVGFSTSPAMVVGLVGAGKWETWLITPPWYNHTFNFGSVFGLGGQMASYLSELTLDGTWSQTPQASDTITDVSCPHINNLAIYGFVLNNATNETIYGSLASSAIAPIQVCYISNSYIANGNAGIANVGVSGALTLTNNFVTSLFYSLGDVGSVAAGSYNIIGGTYGLAGGSSGAATLAFPTAGGTSNSQTVLLSGGVQVCSAGTNPAILFNEGAAGVLTITDAKLTCPVTNSGGVTLSAGTAHIKGSVFKAIGTGNTLNVAAGASLFDDSGNSFSGGAGFNIAGSVFGSDSITGTTLVTGNVVISACGTSAASAFSGSSRKGQFTITFAGTPVTTCTATVTFPVAFPVAPVCTFQDVGGTNVFPSSIVNGTVSATSAAATENFASVWTAGSTDIVQYACAIP